MSAFSPLLYACSVLLNLILSMVSVYIKKFDKGLVFSLKATALVSASYASHTLCPLCDGHGFDNVYINSSVMYAICGIGGHQ